MGLFRNWIDGFKRAEPFGSTPSETLPDGDVEKDPDSKDVVARDVLTNSVAFKDEQGHVHVLEEDQVLKRKLHSRHIQFIALGGSIGSGLFIGSGLTLAHGGPGSVMVAYIIISVMVICTVLSLGELAAALPVQGSFATYAVRFIDPSWGFAVGYIFWINWLVAYPNDATVSTIVIRFWDRDEVVPRGVWVAIYMIIMIFINIFGVRGYGEFEFVATLIKVLGCIGFIICAIVIDCGGTPAGQYLGARGWHTQPAFLHGFKGFCSVFITAAFSFSGTELVGLAAAETENPRKFLPKACKQVIARVIIFYILCLFMVTLIVPATTPQLTEQSGSPMASPFVIAIEMGQIYALPQIFNAVILISALSVGNAALYGSSRMLHTMAEQGNAPKIFKFVDRRGRPTPALAVSILFGFISFLVYYTDGETVFTWLMSIAGLSAVFTWGTICLAHFRFRRAWIKQGNTLRQLPWASPLGIYGSALGFVLNVLVIIASFYGNAWPMDESEMDSQKRAYTFFENMLSLPIFFILFLGHKIVTRSRFVRFSEIDVQTGRRDPVPEEVLEKERAEARARPLWKRIFTAIF
ncbi:amino acid transmembrane transporter [Malassezia pachydermatis]|uniref:Amino acid permease n=1 Tax=Malassezia pachydermatis TaxID=77020 RepID=A0A0M8MTM1_9BASI|nr:amino acid permease [Malassezia pachydermatis]KOS13550.1 amino acid permease [Malassezia pachydermatis]